MLDWVALVLKPYVATAPKGIIPAIFLDMFSVHMMVLVVNAIQALGVQVKFIPGSCTGLCQCWRSSLSVLVLILTLVSTGRPGRDAESV